MSLTDFKNMTGLTKDTLDKNQVIKNVPHAQIPDGKGLKFLAEQNGMSVDELLALNGLPKNYKPSKGEHFYVYPKNKVRLKHQNLIRNRSNLRKSPKQLLKHRKLPLRLNLRFSKKRLPLKKSQNKSEMLFLII